MCFRTTVWDVRIVAFVIFEQEVSFLVVTKRRLKQQYIGMGENKALPEGKVEQFGETLKRCPDGTLEALIRYRETGAVEALNTFLIGCIHRHTESEYRSMLEGEHAAVSFIDDLGIDSMTMMEIVMMAEECLEIQIDNQDLMKIATIGDLNAYLKNAH